MESNAGGGSTVADSSHDVTVVSTGQRIIKFFKKVPVKLKLVKPQTTSDKCLSAAEYHTDYHGMYHITHAHVLRAFNVPNSLMAAVMNQHRKFEPLFSGNWAELLAQDNRIGALNLVNFFALHPKVLKAIEEITMQPPSLINQHGFNDEDYYFIKRIFEILGGTWEMDYEQTVFAQEHSHEHTFAPARRAGYENMTLLLEIFGEDNVLRGRWSESW